MKLIDILARELKEWPNGCIDARQSNVDTEVYFYPGTYGADFYATDRAEDYLEAIVTKDQWVNAVDALKKVSVEPWNGEGLPPVGTVCEHRTGPGMRWSIATVIAHGAKKIFYRDQDGHEWTRLYDEIEFRQIHTPEQIAAEERESAIYGMLCHDALGGTRRGLAEALYDAGYRKQEVK